MDFHLCFIEFILIISLSLPKLLPDPSQFMYPVNFVVFFYLLTPKAKQKENQNKQKPLEKNTKPKQQSNQNNNNKIREKAYKNPQGEHLRPFCIL